MWAQHCVRPIASSGDIAIKKEKHFVNQCSWSLLTSPLEGTPAALRGCHTAHWPSSCSAPSLRRSIKS